MTANADLERKVKQIDAFLLKGEEVRVSVDVKRGQGRIFGAALDKLNLITGKLENAKVIAKPSQKGAGYQTVIRAGSSIGRALDLQSGR